MKPSKVILMIFVMCCRWLFGGRPSSSVVCWTVWCLLHRHRSSTANTTTPFISHGPLEPASSNSRRNMWAPNNATPQITKDNSSEGFWRLILLSSCRRSSSWETGILKTEADSWRSCRHCPPISTSGWSCRLASAWLFFLLYICLNILRNVQPHANAVGKNSLLQKWFV